MVRPSLLICVFYLLTLLVMTNGVDRRPSLPPNLPHPSHNHQLRRRRARPARETERELLG